MYAPHLESARAMGKRRDLGRGLMACESVLLTRAFYLTMGGITLCLLTHYMQ